MSSLIFPLFSATAKLDEQLAVWENEHILSGLFGGVFRESFIYIYKYIYKNQQHTRTPPNKRTTKRGGLRGGDGLTRKCNGIMGLAGIRRGEPARNPGRTGPGSTGIRPVVFRCLARHRNELFREFGDSRGLLVNN